MPDLDPAVARRLWRTLEPYHAIVYFAPERAQAYTAAGLKGGWMGYFASRAAAMGPVRPQVVAATFFNFHPAMVYRAIPDAWSLSTVERVLEARLQVVDAALRRTLGDAINDPALGEAATIARRAAEACPADGRPLGAAHAGLPWPRQSHVILWHALTILREFRGDGHVAALVTEGFDGLEANVTISLAGGPSPELIQAARGWSPQEWGAAVERLADRGVVELTGGSARLSSTGAAIRDGLERRTDELALPPLRALGADATERLVKLAAPFAALAGADVSYPNPMGLPRAGP